MGIYIDAQTVKYIPRKQIRNINSKSDNSKGGPKCQNTDILIESNVINYFLTFTKYDVIFFFIDATDKVWKLKLSRFEALEDDNCDGWELSFNSLATDGRRQCLVGAVFAVTATLQGKWSHDILQRSSEAKGNEGHNKSSFIEN